VSVRLLEELVQIKDRDVLDVGCGEGYVARRLAEAGARVVALDPLPGAIEVARATAPEGPSLRYVEGSAEALPFADQSFDAVIFFNSLHHVALHAMELALDQAARVLRPGGVLYVQEPLAQGAAFELLRQIEDETGVRSAALEALAAVSEGPFESLSSREIVLTVRHADFAALRARTVSVDPARSSAFDARHEELQEAFERLGRPADGGGYEFDQPFRIEVLRRRGTAPAG
jgi:ubiquinone/menaquinone biosynthesis C-methylase UbiE